MRKMSWGLSALMVLLLWFPSANAQELSATQRAILSKKNSGVQAHVLSPLKMSAASSQKSDLLIEDLQGADLFEINKQDLNQLFQSESDLLEVHIPSAQGEFVLELEPYSPIIDGFTVRTPEGVYPYDASAVRHYRGVVQGEARSVVGISVSNGNIQGVITTDKGNFNLGKLENNDDLFVLFSDQSMVMPVSSFCGTDELNVVVPEKEIENHEKSGSSCVKIYMELDYDFYQEFGSVSAATNFMTSVFNEVSILYSNENLNVQLSEIFVWSSNSPYNSASSSTMLADFRSTRTSFNGDLAHLVDLNPSNGGVAYVDVLCVPSYAYGYSGIYTNYEQVPTYSWTVEVITHELGHNLGSNHTHSCDWPGGPIDNCMTQEGTCLAGPAPQNGGTIMSYCHLTSHGINFNHGFGPLPGDKIRERVAAASCLGTCGPVCEVPSNINASNVTMTDADVTWNGAGDATNYTFMYRASGGSWSTSTLASTSTHLSGLSENTSYEVKIESNCPELSSGFSSVYTFTTQAAPVPCGVPTNLAASNVSEFAADLSWNTAQNAQSFVVEYRIAGGSTWTAQNSNGTSTTLSGLTDNTTYEAHVKSICSNSESDFTAAISFTTVDYVAPITYCASSGNNSSDEWIQQIQIGSLSNNSGNNGGYASYTTSVEYTAGESYSLSLTPGFSGSFWGTNSYPEYWKVWIDLNHDGDFTDANELVFDAGTTSETTVNGSMSIPANAASVVTRMRVSMKYNGSQTSCETFSYGEVEDYEVTIVSSTPEPCDAPTQLAVTGTTQTSVSLAWTAAGTNETGYQLDYRTGGGAWTSVSTGSTSYTVSGLTANTTYEFRVKANCGSDESAFSGTTSGTTDPVPPCDTPLNLAVTGTSQTSISLNWNAAGSNETGYQLDYRSNGGAWTSVSTGNTNYTVTGLTASTTYEFRVKAACGSEESTFSAVVSGTTDQILPCDAPTNLAVTGSSETSLSVSWSAAGTNETGYTAEIRPTGGSWSAYSTSNTNYTFTGLSASSTYEMRVSADCGSETSPYSSTVSGTTDTPAPCDVPTGLAASSVTESSATLSWNSAAGASSYSVEYRVAGASWTSLSTSNTTISLSGLNAETNYEARVKTICANGESAFSGIVTFTTDAASGPVTYCNAQGNSTADEWIEKFAVNGVSYTSGNNGGYADFTAYTVDLTVGNNASTFTPGFNSGFFGPTTYPEYWRVWIDFNKDGDFTDAGELAFDAGGTSTSAVSGNIVVPAGASGVTRMRIAMKYNGAPSPCESFGYGEVEDIMVNIGNNMPSHESFTMASSLPFTMTLAPNPAVNNRSNLSFSLTAERNAGEVKIIDVAGRTLHTSSFNGFENQLIEQSIELPTGQTGFYLIQVQFSNGESFVERLVQP